MSNHLAGKKGLTTGVACTTLTHTHTHIVSVCSVLQTYTIACKMPVKPVAAVMYIL